MHCDTLERAHIDSQWLTFTHTLQPTNTYTPKLSSQRKHWIKAACKKHFEHHGSFWHPWRLLPTSATQRYQRYYDIAQHDLQNNHTIFKLLHTWKPFRIPNLPSKFYVSAARSVSCLRTTPSSHAIRVGHFTSLAPNLHISTSITLCDIAACAHHIPAHGGLIHSRD